MEQRAGVRGRGREGGGAPVATRPGAHRAAWPIFFGGGVLGTAHGIALAATTLMDARISVPIVFIVSGLIVEAGLWLVAKGAGKASLK